MAGRPNPVGPDEGPDESEPGSSPDAPEPGLAGSTRERVVEQIAKAAQDPPVGLIIVGWEPSGSGSPSAPAPTYDRQIEQAVAFTVAGCADRSDRLMSSRRAETVVIRSALGGPAAAEALAHRIAARLDVELDRLAIAADEPTARWAIGVAVSRRDDRAADLLRYAETALDDAWLLGGRRLVAFDDGDRELLDRPTGPPEPE